MSVVVYERRVTGMGLTYREQQRIQIQFLECGVEVAEGSLLMHRQIHHSMVRGYPPLPREACNYWVSFPKMLSRLWCPEEGWLGGGSNRTNLRVKFLHCHIQYKIVILEEGN